MERTDVSGRWESDNGATWVLVEPSQAWLDNLPAPEPAPPELEPIDAIAADLPAVTLKEANDLMGRLVTALTDRGIV